MSKPKDDLLRRLWITFEGEPGLDYGGVARFPFSEFGGVPGLLISNFRDLCCTSYQGGDQVITFESFHFPSQGVVLCVIQGNV